jgi:hypothetical protein
MIGTNRLLKLSRPVTEWWRVFFARLYFQFCLRSSERTGNSGLSPPLRSRLKCASQNPRALAGRKQPATLHFFHFDNVHLFAGGKRTHYGRCLVFNLFAHRDLTILDSFQDERNFLQALVD